VDRLRKLLADEVIVRREFGVVRERLINAIGACLGPNDNLLQNSSTTYSANNFALYHQVKLEFDQLNYNLLTDTVSYNFNPWVNVLIHGSNYVNAPNVYAYSVDDAVGNLQAEGTGFIIDVGSTKNLCTGATPCPNQNPAGPPININYALNRSFQFNFTNFGVCKFDPTDPVSYKSVNTLNTSFIISANNPKHVVAPERPDTVTSFRELR
jgi:hypothetical protein